MEKIQWFLIVIISMFLLSLIISTINGNINYVLEPVLQNNIIHRIQGNIYKKAREFNLEDFEDKNFYDLYYFVVQNGKDEILNSINLLTTVLISILSIIGISTIILQYDLVIVGISVMGVILSCLCSMKMKEIQYKYKVAAIPASREINYIDKIFYINDYIKEILAFAHSNIFENKYSTAWEKMNEITKTWGKKIRSQYILIIQNNSNLLNPQAFIHSDQGAHYTSPRFQKLLKKYKLGQSMLRRGNCWDNDPQESFFGHMKDEIDYKGCNTFEELQTMINKYMDYHNNFRYQRGLKS